MVKPYADYLLYTNDDSTTSTSAHQGQGAARRRPTIKPGNVPGYKNRPAGLTQQGSPRITDIIKYCSQEFGFRRASQKPKRFPPRPAGARPPHGRQRRAASTSSLSTLQPRSFQLPKSKCL